MAAKEPGSSRHRSTRNASPRRAAWCLRCSTTAASPRRRWLPFAGPRSSGELGQSAERAVNSGNALDHRRARGGDLALLENDNRQAGKGFEQFAGPQQEIGVARPPQPLVAHGEGLVDQYATCRECLADRREQRAMEVIGHDDRVIAVAERPCGAALQIDL